MLSAPTETKRLADMLTDELPVENVELRQTHAAGGKPDTMPTHYQTLPYGLAELQQSPSHHEGHHDPGIWVLTFDAGGQRHMARLVPEKFYKRHAQQHHQAGLLGGVESGWSSWRPEMRRLAQQAYVVIHDMLAQKGLLSTS